MRFIMIGLLLLVMGIQYKLWFGNDSVPKWFKMEKKYKQQQEANQSLQARNQLLEKDIAELKSGESALEERARYELGMVKEDETYYHFVN